jgi:ABC-type branched-subunit amino acid transport system permease subunit
MKKLFLAVKIICWLFIIAGVVGVVYHAPEMNTHDPFANEVLWMLLVRLLAIVGGIVTLRGANWGRWLLLVWMAYHVALSAFHTLFELAIHIIFMAVIAYFLFRPKDGPYFQRAKPEKEKAPRLAEPS